MDRRYTLGQPGAQGRVNHQNSYIPTNAINNNNNSTAGGGGTSTFSYHHSKQQQMMSHHNHSSSLLHHHHHHSSTTSNGGPMLHSANSSNNMNSTYSNLPPPTLGSRGQMTEHHHPTNGTNNGPMMHRTLPKSNNSSSMYSNGPTMMANSHYGNVMTVGSPPHNHNNNMVYYGTTTNGGSNSNGPIIMNGGTNHATILPVVPNNGTNGVYGISGQMNNHTRTNLPQSGITYGSGLENLGSTEGLPPSLVESMRTLFDILDDSKQGKIRLSDIESRWEQSDSANGSGAEPLIRMGVMGYLRKVTPSDGLLTFDRFCTGLRLALVANNSPANGMIPSGSNQGSLKHPSHMSQHHSTSYLPSQNKVQMNGVNNASLYGTTTGNHGHNHHHHTMNKSQSAVPLLNSNSNNNTNTGGRSSKIPSLSSSRLPMPNSSNSLNSSSTPSHNNIGLPNGRIVMNGAPAFNSGNGVSSGIPGLHNNKKHSEHGTTVAMVHSHPQGGVQSGTLKSTGSSRLTNNSKSNGSLDNLKATLEEKLSLGPPKDRPPSAPLLDVEAQKKDNQHSQQYHTNVHSTMGSHSSNSTVNRRRAKSTDRDHDHDRKQHGTQQHKDEEGKKQVSFATSRQRTLSMPQLQLNKLKTKSSTMTEQESGTNNVSKPQGSGSSGTSSSTTGLNGTLKFSVHNKSHHTGGGGGGSSIPTFASARSLKTNSNSNSALDYTGDNAQQHGGSGKELPAPPPKPPRNPASSSAMVTIVTNNNNSGTGEAPHSGSSMGSSSQSCSTLSSTSTNSSKVMEARKPLVWQKGLTTAAEKKPIEQSLSVANVTATSVVVANNKNNSGNINSGGNNGNNGGLQTLLPAPGVKSHTQHNSATKEANKLKNKSNLRRKETARRHTVQSGIDFATLKKLKQLEQERDVLQQGLSFLENTKEWYQKQLEGVEEKITLLNKGVSANEHWSETSEERLNLLGCRVSELNSLMAALMDGSARVPEHMDLQLPSHLSLRTITRLKEQNRQLTQEVSDCGHRVTQLETEKAMLLRQLFHQKNALQPEEPAYM